LKLAGAQSRRVHINDLIQGKESIEATYPGFRGRLQLGGRPRRRSASCRQDEVQPGNPLEGFIQSGRLIIGICNGFQALVNLGLLPALNKNYRERRVALIANRSGNFIDIWVNLKVNPLSPCVFTNGISQIELPVRHGEGQFYASDDDMAALSRENQIVLRMLMKKGTQRKDVGLSTRTAPFMTWQASAIPQAAYSGSCPTPRHFIISPTILTGQGKKKPWPGRVKASPMKVETVFKFSGMPCTSSARKFSFTTEPQSTEGFSVFAYREIPIGENMLLHR
jgi:phosphoribosylformylglycinamidine (FGAM) synthase-like amidotransferase family enzyme